MDSLARHNIHLVALIGIVFSLVLTWQLYSFESKNINDEFKLHVNEEIEFINREIALNFNAITALEALFKTQKNVTQQQFALFSKDLLIHHPNIEALEWVPKIAHANRAQFEQQIQRSNPTFQITERKPDGILLKAQNRNTYYPITFIEPVTDNEAALGFDLGSSKLREIALKQARDTGSLVITDTIELVQDQQKSIAFLAFMPVYQGMPTTQKLRNELLSGFVVGVFKVNKLIDSAIHHSSVKDIHIELEEVLANTTKSIYKTPYNEQQIFRDLSYKTSLKFGGGHRWNIIAAPTDHYMAIRRSPQPLIFGFIVLILTVTLCFYLSIIFRHADAIEQAVKERTLELQQARDELERQSLNDGLTDIANRRQFDIFLKHAWAQAIRNEKPISALMIDIDYFKQYNDNYGHQQGDFALKQVAQTLKKALSRNTDFVARYGGEEFIVLLPDSEDGSDIAEICRQKVEQLRLPHLLSKSSKFVTISIGSAVLYPSPHDDVGLLLKQADEALYTAKASGRNCVQPYQYPHSSVVQRIK
jgi:diguanylate cyclase (GGDEF)-like protein